MAGGGFQNVSRQMRRGQDNHGAIPEIENDRDRKVVRHREHPKHPVLRADFQTRIGGFHSLPEAVVREHDALALSRRAGAEADKGRVERGERIRPRGRGSTAQGSKFEPDPALRLVSRMDQEIQADRRGQRFPLGRRELGGDRDKTSAGTQDPQRQRNVSGPVPGLQPDARSRAAGNGFAQTLRDRRAPLVQLPIRRGPGPLDHRDAARIRPSKNPLGNIETPVRSVRKTALGGQCVHTDAINS